MFSGNARIWDLNDWLKMFKASNAYPMQNSIMLGRTNEDAKMATTKNYGFYKICMFLCFFCRFNIRFNFKLRKVVTSGRGIPPD